MQINVTFFSLFRQFSGTDQLLVDLIEGANVGVLLETLSEKFQTPALKNQPASVMVNHRVVPSHTVLQEGDQVLLLPIMEGG
jgi:molybdopterin converting factor small subunit